MAKGSIFWALNRCARFYKPPKSIHYNSRSEMEIEYAAINFLKEKDDLKDYGISKDINYVKYIYCNASRN